MNVVDGGGGGGSPPAPTPPAPTNDPPAPAAVALVDEATRKAIADDARNSVFAELRRSGVLPSSGTRQSPTPSPSSPPSPASTAVPLAADPIKLRALDRALTRAGHTPAEPAYARLEQAFTADAPDDPDKWLATYYEGFGFKSNAAPAAAPAAAPQPAPHVRPAGPPVSDRGAPPPPAVALEQQNLLAMSPSDRDALVKLKGEKWFSDTLAAQLKQGGVKIVVRR